MCPFKKNTIAFLALLFFCFNTYSQITIDATAGQTFGIRMTLDSVFDDINAGVYQGDIVIKIQKGFTLTRTAKLTRTNNGYSNYNSIKLTVSDTATVPVTISANYNNTSSIKTIIQLRGVSNFLLDGSARNLSLNKLIYFQFSSTITNSIDKSIVLIDSGCVNCEFSNSVFKYLGTKSNYNISIWIHTIYSSDSLIKINNNLFLNGMSQITIQLNNGQNSFSTSEIKGNNFIDFEQYGVSIHNRLINLKIDSNYFYHTNNFIPNHINNVIALYVSLISNYSLNKIFITNNRIFNLKNDSASIAGINILTDQNNYINTTGIFSFAYCYNNSITLLNSNSLINLWTNYSITNYRSIGAIGITNNQLYVDFQYNTFRVGGACLFTYDVWKWPNSNVFGNGFKLSDSSSRCIFKNNLLINERMGCNMSIHSICNENDSFSYKINNCDYNNYYALNNSGSNIIFQKGNKSYSNLTDFQNDRIPLDAHSTFYQVSFSDSINSRIAPTSQNNINLLGVPSPNVTTDIDGNPRDPRYPYKGASEPAPFQFHDLQVQAVINLNDSFINCKNQALKLRILNNGNVGDSFSVNNPLQVNTKIIRPGGSVLNLPTSTINSGMLNSGDSMDIILSNALNMDSVGVYTFTTYLSRTIDYNRSNDTLTFTRRVLNNEYGDSAVQAIQLNAQSTLKTQAGALSNQLTKTFTIETWINPSTITAGNIITKDSTPFALQLNAQGYVQFITKTNNAQQTLISNTPLTPNQWTHIAAVYDSSQMILYINGKLDNAITQSGSITYNNGNTAITIGKTNTQNSVQAQLDELKIWNTARTTEQIRTGMHNRIANNTQASLLAYWRFDEPLNYYRFGDASGNCNTLFNASTNNSNKTNCYLPLQTNIITKQQIIQSSNNTIYTNTQFNQTDSNHNNIDTTVVYYLNKTPQQTQINNGYATQKQTWLYYNYGNGSQSQQTSTFTLNNNSFKNAANLNDFTLFRRGAAESGNWTAIIIGASSMDTINKTVSFSSNTAIPTNSQLAIGIKYQSTPVTWLSFEGKAQHKDVHLQWETVNEINNKGFYILESTIPKALRALAFVPADDYSLPAAVQAIHESPQRYTYTHANALSDGQTHYYQLKQIDNDGQYSLSKIIAIQPTQLINEDNIIIYPNPFNESLIIETNTNETQHVQLIGMDGRVWMETEIKQREELKTEELPEGVYVLRVGEQAIKVLK